METIQLGVDERVLKKFGEEKIREYVNRMISMKKLEFYTDLISKAIDMPEKEYQKKLDEIRKESWEQYKKDLPPISIWKSQKFKSWKFRYLYIQCFIW